MKVRDGKLVVLAVLLAVTGACGGDDPSPAPTTGTPTSSPDTGQTASPSPDAGQTASPSPSPGQTTGGSPGADPLVLSQGRTDNGISWQLRVQTGRPVCVQLRRTDQAGDFLVCDEDSEQDFNGDERLRYAFGGLNPDQVPKFVIGITDPAVRKVRIDLPEGTSPEVDTVASSQVRDRRFFVVELPSEPAQEVQAVRGLDAQGRTVAGFRLGPPGEAPSPLPTG
ncbi:MAG TPA: hypothetical protein VHJ78_09620 [Actinomycetota bacterium]|nr:hypothetical protein [Actinomycetota bacterium]